MILIDVLIMICLVIFITVYSVHMIKKNSKKAKLKKDYEN